MKLKSSNYNIIYNPENATIICSGSLELRGKEGYTDVTKMFKTIVETVPPHITLDIKELEFLNTTGIAVFGGFIVNVRKKGNISLKITGSKKYSWQIKSLKGLHKLMPEMKIEFIKVDK